MAVIAMVFCVKQTPAIATYSVNTIGTETMNGQGPFYIVWINSKHRNDRVSFGPFGAFTVLCIVLHDSLLKGTYRFTDINEIGLEVKKVSDVGRQGCVVAHLGGT